MKLHPYQIRAVKFALIKAGSYQMLDFGLGKTAVAIKWSDAIDNKTLVLGPLNVIYNTWPTEIQKWAPHRTYSIIHGKKKFAALKKDVDYYLLNYEGLKWFYKLIVRGFKIPRFTLILDESSWIKDPSTKRFKMLKNLLPLLSDWKMNLSATPSMKGLHGLWSQYYILDKGKSLGSVNSHFIRTYFDVGIPPMCIKIPKPGANKAIYKRIAPITYRLAAKDYLKLPPLIVNDVKIKLPPRLRSQYDTLAYNFMLQVESETVSAVNAAVLSSKLRQFLQGAMYKEDSKEYIPIHFEKMYMLKDILEGLNGTSVMIAIQFRFEVIELRKLIGKFHTLVGSQKASYNRKVVIAWNTGQLNRLVVHPATVAYGLNLQGGGHNIIWLGLTWSTEHYHQLIARLHRQGQTKPVTVTRIIFEDTVDEVVADTLKRDTINQEELFKAVINYMRTV